MKNKKILIIASSATLEYPTTHNIWYVMQHLFLETYILLKQNGEWVITKTTNRQNMPVIKFRFKTSFNPMMEFLAIWSIIKLRRDVDVVLLIGCPFSTLLSIVAKLLNKKLIIFLGGSRLDVLRTYIKNHNFPIFKLVQLVLLDIGFNFFTLFFCDKIIIQSYRLYDDPIVSMFKYKTRQAYNLPSNLFYTIFDSKIDVSKRDLIVGFIGLSRVVKGIHLFLRSIPLVHAKRPDIKFLIISDYSKCEPLSMFEEISQTSKWKNVEIIPYIANDLLPNYYNKMKLLVIPSFTEGLPHVAIEAMACRTPILCTNVGDLHLFVKHEYSGLLLPDNNPENISKYILMYIDETEKLTQITNNAYNTIRSKLTCDQMISNWRSVMVE